MTHSTIYDDPYLDELLQQEQEPSLSPELSRRVDERLRQFRGPLPEGLIEAEVGKMGIFD